MADVGDQKPSFDASSTTPFPKVVLPAEETIRISKPPAPGPSMPVRPPQQDPREKTPDQPPQQPPASPPDQAATLPSVQPPAQAAAAPPAQPAAPPSVQPPPQVGGQPSGRPSGQPTWPPVPPPGRHFGLPPAQHPSPPLPQHPSPPPPQHPSLPPPQHPGPPPIQRVGQPPVPYPSRPAEGLPEQVPLKPPARGIGDIPIRVVYLIGAIIGTVVAVLLVFVLFSGDVPANQQAEQAVSVAPVPPSAAAPTASPTPTPTPTPTGTPIVLPPVPASKAYATLPGKAAAVTGLITDKKNGITYPRLAAPWKARSYPPFTIAQRIGEVKMPYTVIGSAMYPGESPAKKPTSNADYRKIAAEGVRWTIRTQYPKGATISWTASQKIPVGKGWTLGYKVTYPVDGGKKQTAQAMLAVIEVGKTKPAMLLASIPEANKAHWRDLNTLAQQVRPL